MGGQRWQRYLIILAMLLVGAGLISGCRAAGPETTPSPASNARASEGISDAVGALPSVATASPAREVATAIVGNEPNTRSDVADEVSAPDPSPDRPPIRIAFIRRGHESTGDVYVLDTRSGVETRITDDGLNLGPWWTADGLTLLFQKILDDRVVETWRGQPESEFVRDRSGLWSPDGTMVAFAEPLAGVESGMVVWIETASQRWQLTPSVPGVHWQPLAWSSDDRLAVVRLETAAGTEDQRGVALPITKATLWVTDAGAPADGLREIAMPSLRGEAVVPEAAAWAPNARFLAVGVAPAISCVACRADGLVYYVVPTDGGPPVELDSARIEVGALAWAPDSSFVMLSASGWRQIYDDKQILRFDPLTGERQDLSGNLDWADIQPSVSPDGAWIAFTRGQALRQLTGGLEPTSLTPRDAVASRRIWLMRPDGSQAHPLLDDASWSDESPVWTADGAWIVFVRWRPPNDGVAPTFELWAVRPDGTDAQRLVGNLGPPNGIGPNLTVGYHSGFRWGEMFAVAPR